MCGVDSFPTLIRFGVFIAVGGASLAQACICVPRSAPEAIELASVIFLGRLVGDGNDGPVMNPLRFEGIEVLKGGLGSSTVEVNWSNCVSSPGPPPFVPGEEYLIYGSGDPDARPLHTSACDRNLTRREALVDLFHLRRLQSRVRLEVNRSGEELALSVQGGDGRSFALEVSERLGGWRELARGHTLSSNEAPFPEVPAAGAQQFFRLREVEPQQGIIGQIRGSTEDCELLPSIQGFGARLRFLDYLVREASTQPGAPCDGPVVASFAPMTTTARSRFFSTRHVPQLDEGQLSPAFAQVLRGAGYQFEPARAEVEVLQSGGAWRVVEIESRTVLSIVKTVLGADGERLMVSANLTFAAPLPPGEYCLDGLFGCATSFRVEPGEWQFLELRWPSSNQWLGN